MSYSKIHNFCSYGWLARFIPSMDINHFSLSIAFSVPYYVKETRT